MGEVRRGLGDMSLWYRVALPLRPDQLWNHRNHLERWDRFRLCSIENVHRATDQGYPLPVQKSGDSTHLRERIC
jgi:hypothetical protein